MRERKNRQEHKLPDKGVNANTNQYSDLRGELEHRKVEPWLARVHAPIRQVLRRTWLTDRIDDKYTYPSVGAGVQAYLEGIGCV